jgi:alanyl-tRNA synthetase
MAQELKHVGRVKATNKKCLIAYRTLPGEAHYCLIIPTENLPDIYHDALINLVESNAGQESYEFAEAMDRTQFPDGSRMLPALHATGRLIKVATGAIEMTPTTGYSLLLSELNQVIAEQRGVSVDDLSLKESLEDKVKETKKTETVTKVEELAQTSEPTTFDSPETEAKYYRSQADKMAKQAAEMRRKAEELVPTKKKV